MQPINLPEGDSVAHLRKKIYEENENELKDLDSSHLIIKWKDKELEAHYKLSNIPDLNLANSENPVIVEIGPGKISFFFFFNRNEFSFLITSSPFCELIFIQDA